MFIWQSILVFEIEMTETIQIMKDCWGNTPRFMVRKVDRGFSWILIENDLTSQSCRGRPHRGSYHCLADYPGWCPKAPPCKDSPGWNCCEICPTRTWSSPRKDTEALAHLEDAWNPGGRTPPPPPRQYLNGWLVNNKNCFNFYFTYNWFWWLKVVLRKLLINIVFSLTVWSRYW